MIPTHEDTGKVLSAYKPVIILEKLHILKLLEPTKSGYTHALQADSGETVGWLEHMPDGGYKVILYDGYKTKDDVVYM